MKRIKYVEAISLIFICLTVVFTGAVSILDLFDLLNEITFIKARIPTITLLLVSTSVLGLVVYVTSVLSRKLDSIEDSMLSLQSYVHQDTIERVKSLRRQIEPNLEAVFGNLISDSLNNIVQALKEHRVRFNDVELFRYLYKVTLEKYPNAMFMATSLPYEKYFWRDRPMEEAIERFIDKGGVMKRIFFLKSMDELGTEEVAQIISTQCSIGVEVYVAVKSKIPRELRRFFVVDEGRQFAWELEVDQDRDNEVTQITATTNQKDIDDYIVSFNRLLGSKETQRLVTQLCKRD